MRWTPRSRRGDRFMTDTERPDKVCRIDWRHEGKTGVWLYVDPRPDEAAILDICQRVASAIEPATTEAALEAAADEVRRELGYQHVFVSGFDQQLDLAVYIGLRWERLRSG
jgi:hypothetical protein